MNISLPNSLKEYVKERVEEEHCVLPVSVRDICNVVDLR